jgi:catechol 2,3-dioxygenase-like lactoylglutathione lyase family enzyme
MSSPIDEWMELPQPDAAAWLSQLAGRGAFGEMALDHVGIAVHDIDEAIARFSASLGVHDWMRSSFATTSAYRGVEQLIGGNVALVAFGPISLELVQPTQGAWTPVDVLESRGEGMYHVGFQVPDVAAAARRASEAGLHVALVGTHRDAPIFAYMESDELHGVTVELVAPRMPQQMITAAEPIQ